MSIYRRPVFLIEKSQLFLGNADFPIGESRKFCGEKYLLAIPHFAVLSEKLTSAEESES